MVMDRSFDPLSPMMHEYTYQAMMNDLLDVDEGVVSYEAVNNKGVKEEKKALLSENDEFWAELRHKHIAGVIDALKEKMANIMNQNTALSKQGDGKEMDISSMAAAIKKLPEYTQTMTKLGQHVALAQQCMNQFSKQYLMDLSQVEQTICTGVDEDGKEVKGARLFQLVTDMLTNKEKKIDKDQKVRLLAIYYVSQKNVPEEMEYVKQALAQAKLIGGEKTLKNLERIIHASSIPQEKEVVEKEEKKGGILSSIFRGKAVKHASTPEGEYADTRHISELKVHLEQFVAGELPIDKFPAIGPAGGAAAAGAKSVRKFGANSRWAKKDTFTGGRFLVYIAGGISYQELRVGYEVMKANSKEIVMGGTNLISPHSYLVDIGSLKQ